MKILKWIIATLLGLVVLVLSLQYFASERVEVVELHAPDETGEMVTTRLWVVDDSGYQYLRVGADGSGWYSRLQAAGTFKITRNDETNNYTAVPRPEKRDTINNLMMQKYTWGDDLIARLVGGRDGSIPIELHPVDAALDAR